LTKIGIDCTPLIRGRVGGFENYLINLLEGLAEAKPADVSATLFVRRDQLDSFREFEGAFRIHPVSLRNNIQRILWENLVLPFRSRAYSVMLFPANVRPLVLLCPSVTVMQDLQYLHFPEFWPRHLLLHRRILVPRSVRTSSVLIATSESVAEQVRQAFGRQDITVIHIPIRLVSKAGTAERAAAVPEPFFLVPSLLTPHKNIPALLEAITELEDQLPDLPHFVFIGAYRAEDFPGPVTCNKVRVLGFVDRQRKDALVRRCLALVLPSRYEGFGMPYVESLLAEKPAIASDIATAREMLGDEATYIPAPHGAREIAATIRTFLEAPRAAPSGDSARRVLASTTPFHVAQRYLDTLLSAARRAPR